MEYIDQQFIFSCTNDKDNQIADQVVENRGIGLLNLQRRLQLLYENQHELIIKDNEHEFSISLLVNIK